MSRYPPNPMCHGLQLAVNAMGSKRKLAQALGLHPSNLASWYYVPAHHARRIEELTGVPRARLNPDIFG